MGELPFDLAKTGMAVRATKRQIVAAERRSSTDVSTSNARQTLREAQFAVAELVLLLNAAPGRGMNFPLIRQIGAAEIRVAEAREALMRIDPTAME